MTISSYVHARCDVLIVGGGIAGLMTALRLAPLSVTLILKSSLSVGSSTTWAQAGFAAALGVDDSVTQHADDTLAAGAGICDPDVVGLMTREAPGRIQELVDLGVPFDRHPDGSFRLHREAAHEADRVIGVGGDRTGRAFMETIVPLVRSSNKIRIIEEASAEALVMSGDRVSGAFVRGEATKSNPSGETVVLAKAVLLATGGIGGLYRVTTNPPETIGEGIAMAARVGAELADLEFVQFHPTAMNVGLSPAPLATESIRGEGALLVTKSGDRFMSELHPAGELAPRDVVARGVDEQLQGGKGAFLDCREAIGSRFEEAFPTVAESCRRVGIDPATERIPIAPAEHYHMGGIATDAEGRTTVSGLWACGESASGGVHGANRLASNSMLEGLVFSARCADSIAASVGAVPEIDPAKTKIHGAVGQDSDLSVLVDSLRTLMSDSVGVVRTADGLKHAVKETARIESEASGRSSSIASAALTARLIATSAYLRCESRGSHFRADFPSMDLGQAKRSWITLEEANQFLATLK